MKRWSLDARTLRAELPQPIVLVVGEKEGIIRRAQWGNHSAHDLRRREEDRTTRDLRRPSLDARTLRAEPPQPVVLGVGGEEKGSFDGHSGGTIQPMASIEASRMLNECLIV